MAEIENKTAVEINRSPPKYPLMIIGGFVFLCLAAVIVLAARDSAWAVFIISGFALVGAISFAYFNSIRKRVGLEHRLDWQPAPTDVQKQTLGLEVEGIAGALQQEAWESTDLFMAYVVAEDLALRQIQQEHNAPMIRHLQVGGAPFDALIIRPDELICADVSFVVQPDLRQEKIDSMLKKCGTVRRFLNSQHLDVDLRLLIVVVTQLTPEEVTDLRSRLTDKRFPDSPVNIDIHFFDFEELQRMYVSQG
ncbi:MAG TPA: hypothetical protein VEV84_13170 [Pyrinomonadaceae bacterium]|nr:hypothetical protein [Pyrinomonadaceae bacterium]